MPAAAGRGARQLFHPAAALSEPPCDGAVVAGSVAGWFPQWHPSGATSTSNIHTGLHPVETTSAAPSVTLWQPPGHQKISTLVLPSTGSVTAISPVVPVMDAPKFPHRVFHRWKPVWKPSGNSPTATVQPAGDKPVAVMRWKRLWLPVRIRQWQQRPACHNTVSTTVSDDATRYETTDVTRVRPDLLKHGKRAVSIPWAHDANNVKIAVPAIWHQHAEAARSRADPNHYLCENRDRARWG